MNILGCDKFPTENDLPPYWAENKDALLTYMDHVSGPPVLIVNYWSTLRFTAESMVLFMMLKLDVRSEGQLSESKETHTVSPLPKMANTGASYPQATTRSPSLPQLQQAMIISTIGLLQSVPVMDPRPLLDWTFTSKYSYFKVHFVFTVLYFSVLVVPKFTYFWAWTVNCTTISDRLVGFSAAGNGFQKKTQSFYKCMCKYCNALHCPLFAQTFVLFCLASFACKSQNLNYFLQPVISSKTFISSPATLHEKFIKTKIKNHFRSFFGIRA